MDIFIVLVWMLYLYQEPGLSMVEQELSLHTIHEGKKIKKSSREDEDLARRVLRGGRI